MNPNNTAHSRNHYAIPMEDGTALLIFESHCGDRSRIPDIVRFYKACYEFTPMDRGRLFVANSRRNCCLVIKAIRGDLVVIAEPRHQESGFDCLFLRIGEDFVPETIEHGRKPTYSEIHEVLSSKKTKPSGSLSLTNYDLRLLFSAHVPSWLESILLEQLDSWKTQDLAAFVNFTPSAPEPGDLDRCVTAAPFTMLERWKDCLDDRLIERCIRHSSEGAVRYALDKIPDHLREDYLFENAAIALDLWPTKLSETDWATCALAFPKDAYALRMQLTTRNKAYILATVYDILWIYPTSNPSAVEGKEIMESIVEHPDVWLSLHESNFIRMFEKIEQVASVRPGSNEIQSLINHSNNNVRKCIHEYIATQL
jgi:hypothetical protein